MTSVAIVHYHLNRGAVTQAIANHLRGLDLAIPGQSRLQVALITGGRAEGWPEDFAARLSKVDLAMGVAPDLEYDVRPVENAERLASQLREELSGLGFLPAKTVIHIHNHGLGKNASLPGAVRILAEEGFALLLQIHDFAEDYRAGNYRHLRAAWGDEGLPDLLYPQSEHVHYGVVNRRDYRVLAEAGIESSRLHHLPNPVFPWLASADRESARHRLQERFGIPPSARFVLCPIRPICRKNLGETLLWAILAGPATHFGISLAPLSPAERRPYCRWKKVAHDLGLNVHFEIAEADGLPFEENFAAADSILSTSVAEGFGAVFLKPWLADRWVIGRDVPDITCDFTAAGVELAHLYPRFQIPLSLVGREAFLETLAAGYRALLHSYHCPVPRAQVLSEWLSRRIEEGSIDFADLDADHQERVIRRLHGIPVWREAVLKLNPNVRGFLAGGPPVPSEIQRNHRTIEEEYALLKGGERLLSVYRSVVASPRGASLARPPRGEAILQQFLGPQRFRPILANV